jgi:type IV pilus assembly protein PilA
MNSLVIRKKNEVSKKKKKGFTLIELIIVIAIIAILAAIALPKFGQIRESGNVKADIATAKEIQTAITTAVSNGDLSLPTSSTTTTITNTEVATYLNGGVVPTPKSKEAKAAGGGFTATLASDGTVTVNAGGIQVFPTPSAPYVIS